MMTDFCSPQYTHTHIHWPSRIHISVKGRNSNNTKEKATGLKLPMSPWWYGPTYNWAQLAQSVGPKQCFNKIKTNKIQSRLYSSFYRWISSFYSHHKGEFLIFFHNGAKGPWRRRCWGSRQSHCGSDQNWCFVPTEVTTLHNRPLPPSTSKVFPLSTFYTWERRSAKSLSNLDTEERARNFETSTAGLEFWLLH